MAESSNASAWKFWERMNQSIVPCNTHMFHCTFSNFYRLKYCSMITCYDDLSTVVQTVSFSNFIPNGTQRIREHNLRGKIHMHNELYKQINLDETECGTIRINKLWNNTDTHQQARNWYTQTSSHKSATPAYILESSTEVISIKPAPSSAT